MIIVKKAHILSQYVPVTAEKYCLISSPTNRISSIVRSIKTLTTKEIGKPIFQRSYYDHIIRNQQDYNEIWQYIENNPKKWLITK